MAQDRRTLSVAMTTYNGAVYVERQLDSLVAQDRLPDEVVVGDDGSTDGTPDLVEAFAQRSAVPVRLLRNPVNLGWRGNFMATASRCTGDLVAFCDQDDVWHPDKLSRMERVFDDPDVTMAYHNAALVGGDGEPLGALFGPPAGTETKQGPLEPDIWAPILGFSMVLRHDLLAFGHLWEDSSDKLDPTERAAHDQWFQFLAAVLGTTAYVDEHLVDYRLHQSNSMGYRHTRWKLDDVVVTWRQSHRKVLDRRALVGNRVGVLERILEERPDLATQVERALAAYRAHLKTTEERLALYGRPLSVRVRRLSSLVRGGAYRSGVLPLARKEAVRDVLVTALGHR